MKKTIFLILMLFVSSASFAMGTRNNLSPTSQCYADADKACIATCGDPNNPNFPHSVKSQSNVTGVEYLKNPDGSFTWNNPKYDSSKKTYDPVCFSSCTAKPYSDCRAKYGI